MSKTLLLRLLVLALAGFLVASATKTTNDTSLLDHLPFHRLRTPDAFQSAWNCSQRDHAATCILVPEGLRRPCFFLISYALWNPYWTHAMRNGLSTRLLDFANSEKDHIGFAVIDYHGDMKDGSVDFGLAEIVREAGGHYGGSPYQTLKCFHRGRQVEDLWGADFKLDADDVWKNLAALCQQRGGRTEL
ncbi:hypothetical protein BDZ88DRAFT_413792 [Geranomyces variabilis]|nr:hypothetical protein BDZ88DRAFT_413792 [Geranomyces variabilis]